MGFRPGRSPAEFDPATMSASIDEIGDGSLPGVIDHDEEYGVLWHCEHPHLTIGEAQECVAVFSRGLWGDEGWFMPVIQQLNDNEEWRRDKP